MKSFKADVICNSFLDGKLTNTRTEHRTVYERADGALEINFVKGRRAARRENGQIIFDLYTRTLQVTTPSFLRRFLRR